MIIEPTILMEENKMKTAMMLATTQSISNLIINLTHFFGTVFFKAVSNTNDEKNIKKIPTSTNGTILAVLNKFAKISGIRTSRIPVIPELIAFISKTFFSVIIFEFCFNKGIFKSTLRRYLYTTSY